MVETFVFLRARGRLFALRTCIAVRNTRKQALETGGIRVA